MWGLIHVRWTAIVLVQRSVSKENVCAPNVTAMVIVPTAKSAKTVSAWPTHVMVSSVRAVRFVRQGRVLRLVQESSVRLERSVSQGNVHRIPVRTKRVHKTRSV